MEEIAQNTLSRMEAGEINPIGSNDNGSMNKYVKAAQMANSGANLDEIMRTVDLTRGEAELVVAMNKDQLVFNQNKLPLWVNPEKAPAPQESSSIGAEFLKALKNTPPMAQSNAPASAAQTQTQQASTALSPKPSATSASLAKSMISDTAIITQNGKTMSVKPFEFKKITTNQ